MSEPKRNKNLWEINVGAHELGISLIKPGASCSAITSELNRYFEDHDVLQYRTFGYGHSFGVLSHYYGREAGLELREDVDTVLNRAWWSRWNRCSLCRKENAGLAAIASMTSWWLAKRMRKTSQVFRTGRTITSLPHRTDQPKWRSVFGAKWSCTGGTGETALGPVSCWQAPPLFDTDARWHGPGPAAR